MRHITKKRVLIGTATIAAVTVSAVAVGWYSLNKALSSSVY